MDFITVNAVKHLNEVNEVKRGEKRSSGFNNDKQSAQTMLDRNVHSPSSKKGNPVEYEKLPM